MAEWWRVIAEESSFHWRAHVKHASLAIRPALPLLILGSTAVHRTDARGKQSKVEAMRNFITVWDHRQWHNTDSPSFFQHTLRKMNFWNYCCNSAAIIVSVQINLSTQIGLLSAHAQFCTVKLSSILRYAKGTFLKTCEVWLCFKSLVIAINQRRPIIPTNVATLEKSHTQIQMWLTRALAVIRNRKQTWMWGKRGRARADKCL